MKLKIAVIITGLGMGGAERQVCDLVDQFAAMGHKILLISMTGEAVNLPRSKSIDVVSLSMCKSPLGIIRAYLKARALVKEFQPDVVHSHMIHANIFSRILRLSIRFPKLICTAHNTNEGGLARVIAYRLTDSLCDVSTNVSQEAVDAFVTQGAVPAGRMCAMYNGIDTTRFKFDTDNRQRYRSELGLTSGELLLLAVGRLNVQKDYPNLIYSLSRLSVSHSQVQLAIIGVGEEHAKLTKLVVSLGLTGRVHFLGMRHNVHEWMSAADIFVLSSAWEGFGLVVAEAMACQRVVVATDCGGVKEVVGECGILVPPKNDIALANGIILALQMNIAESTALGILARERIVTHYSLSAQTERWLSLYL
ncbi:N-acetylgalactosamine-N,N'-diacetylbacillosaminyl-diphospho-undecaprenol 4-alpha-N-acetylgalactosaminyltransferase [Aeromonas rivipollensis]|uniref:glycosyltransferase n=1 Tax=Aeromonas rivipollensis TaxID=948519 RepID=UPI00399CB842